MTTIHLTQQTHLSLRCAATIGFFDGVHLGHEYVVSQLLRHAKERGLVSMVVTFDRHPRQVLHADGQPQQLSTLREKETLLRQTGIDYLVVLPFDDQMANLSAHDFMQHVLLEQLGVELLLTGYDNHFGHRTADSSEGFEDYVRYGQALGIEVVCGQPLILDGQAVSSSRIRRLLSEGKVEAAARCLGRHYGLQGQVVHGEQVGRQIGFPTANLSKTSQMIPWRGVYAVEVSLQGSEMPLAGVTNIGMRPTFDGDRQTIETHILDFHREIYDEQITIHFISRLRDEQHFRCADALAGQMAVDVAKAREILKYHL